MSEEKPHSPSAEAEKTKNDAYSHALRSGGASAQKDSDAPEAEEGTGLLSWRKTIGPWSVALAGVITIAAVLYFRYPGRFEAYQSTGIPESFLVNLKAWQRYLLGENPYVATPDLAFKYSPGFLAFIGLLPTLPQDAWFFFTLVSIAALALSLMVGARYRSWREVLYLGIGLLLSWKGIIECLDNGQPDLLVLALVVIATTLHSRFTILCGAVMGMLPWIKLPYLFMLVPFVLASSRRTPDHAGKPPLRRLKLFVSGFLLSTVFWGAAVPSLTFGPERALILSQSWYRVLLAQPHTFFVSDVNQSLWVTIDRWLDLHQMAAFGVASIVAGVLLALLFHRRPIAPAAQDAFAWVTPWLILCQLLNPLAWRWGSVVLVGSAFSIFRPGRHFPWARQPLWLAVIGVFLIQQNWFVKWAGFTGWTDLHDLGVVTVYWVLLLLLGL